MTPAQITKTTLFSLIGIVFSTILAVDLYLIYFRSEGVSVSNNILAWSSKYPILPLLIGFIFGIIVGHVFWFQEEKKKDTPQ